MHGFETLVVDFNQVCDVQEAVDYTTQLAEFNLWFVLVFSFLLVWFPVLERKLI